MAPNEDIQASDPEPTSQTGARALRWFALGLLVSMLAVITLLIAVDPYRVWGSPDLRGFNACKPFAKTQMRMGKRYQVARRRPRSLVMGTSRSLTGLPLDHPLLRDRDPFAIALVGATPRESADFFALALREGRVERAVMGVEYSRWIGETESRPGYDQARMGARWTLGGWTSPTVDDALRSGLSWPALLASLQTLWRNRDAPPPLETLGSPARWQRDTPEHRKWRSRTLEHFHFKQRETARHAQHNAPNAWKQWENNRSYLVKILELAAEHHVRLEIFVSPCHARYFETLAVSGEWPRYERWLTKLTEIVTAHRGQARLWDFGGYTPFTTEPSPTPTQPSRIMHWYWDISHFTPELGDLLLDAMLSNDPKSPAKTRARGLGLLLNPTLLPEHLLRLREERQRWRSKAPEEVRDVEMIVREQNQP